MVTCQSTKEVLMLTKCLQKVPQILSPFFKPFFEIGFGHFFWEIFRLYKINFKKTYFFESTPS